MDLIGLKELKCPQNWGFEHFKNSEAKFLNKHTNWEWKDEEDPSDNTYASNVSKYAECIRLSFETYRNKKYKEALEYLDHANITDDFMDKYDRVFKHVAKASRAHILYKTNLIDEANQIIKELKEEKFDESEEAAFKYLESRLKAGYGEDGAKDVIELAESAIAVVKDEAEFHYNLGWSLGRIRHFNFPVEPPSPKERQACETAVRFKRNSPSYSLALARLYVDLSCCKVQAKQKEEFRRSATSTYRNLLKFSDSLTGNNIARCVFNLMKISFDSNLEIYVELALKKSKDSILVNHYSGMFYIHNNQYKKAYDCVSKVITELPFMAGVILTMVYRVNGNTISDDEIDSRVEEWIKYYESAIEKKLIQFHLSLSQFYLIVMKNFEKASIHFLHANKCNIIERNNIKLSTKHNSANYLAVLKTELLTCPHKTNQIIDALDAIKKLPREVTSQKKINWSVPSLYELRASLI